MSEPFAAYFEKLERLSTEELDRSAEKLAVAEKRSVAQLTLTSPRSPGERQRSSAATRTSLSTVLAASG